MVSALFMDFSTVFIRLFFSGLLIEYYFPNMKLHPTQVFAVYILIIFITNQNKEKTLAGHIGHELANIFCCLIAATMVYWIFLS